MRRRAERLVMPRCEGQGTAKLNQRDFPHFVDIGVPAGGIGRRLDEMYDWHRSRGLISRHGHGGLFISRWCFAEACDADAFAAIFGGARAT
jgi:hypothetical protein